ncbi:MAG: PKD domain-containing protein [Flavobacteriales bacterium]
MKKLFVLFLFYLGIQLHQLGAQQPGDIDNTFNSIDQGFSFGEGFNGAIHNIVVEPDGKYIVAGDFTIYNGQSRNRIIRLNADGSIDNTFNPGSGFNSSVFALALQSDGKIVAGGSFTSYNGTARNRIARLNSNGTIDTDFNPGTGFNSTVNAIAIQADQKILVGGQFATFNGGARAFIARLESNGTLDNSIDFGTGFSASANIRTIAIQSDNKILIGGAFTTYNSTTSNRIVRIEANGTIDGAFNIGTGAQNTVEDIKILQDGKIYLAGSFTNYNGIGRNRIVRIEANGAIDNTFNPGSGFSTTVNSIAIQADGKIVAGGGFTSFNGVNASRIARILPSGALDTEFNIGTGFNSTINIIRFQADGKIMTGGNQTNYNSNSMAYLGRLNADGTRDFSFNSGSGFNGPVQTIKVASDSRIWVGGTFTRYFNDNTNNIVRLNTDGSRDATFNAAGTGFNNNVFAIEELNDGITLIGGQFSTYNGATHNRIVALNQNGTINTSINFGSGFNGVVRAIVKQPDGKILIGGSFNTYSGNTINRIVRLNTDGSIDAGFNIGTGFSGTVRCIALQSDGKIIVGGEFTSYDGNTARNRIVRLNTDGTLDNGFQVGTAFSNSVTKIVIDNNDRIYAVGEFITFNSVNRNRIVRLNNDGSLDGNFNPGTGFNNSTNDIALQQDGKVIVGGLFTSYGGQTRNFIARLNNDGLLDLAYNVGTGFNNTVNTVAIQSDGKALVGGLFVSYREVGRNRIARLLNPSEDIVITSVNPNPVCRGNEVTVNFNATLFIPTGNLVLELSNSNGNFSNPVVLSTISAVTSGSFTATIPESTPIGEGYRFRIVSSAPALTGSDNGNDVSVVENISVTINGPATTNVNTATTFQASVVGTATTISWDMGDGTTYENQATVQHTFTATGSYTVTLTVDNGVCSSTISQAIEVGTTSVSNFDSDTFIKVFTAGDQLQIINEGQVDKAEVAIFNLAGQMVKQWNQISLNAGSMLSLPTDLKEGVYIVKLQSQQGLISKRIYISK